MIHKQKPNPDMLEVLLAEAGLSFEVVERCQHPECEICAKKLGLEAA